MAASSSPTSFAEFVMDATFDVPTDVLCVRKPWLLVDLGLSYDIEVNPSYILSNPISKIG